MAGLTDNWKKFSEAFKPKTSNLDNDTKPISARSLEGRAKLKDTNASAPQKYTYWSTTQTTMLDEIARIDGPYYVADTSMPNSGTLVHYSEFNGVLTFLALPTLNSEDTKQFRQQLEQIRLPNRIDLINLWDTFLIYPVDSIKILLSFLMPLLPIGGQINFITRTGNVAPQNPGIFYFDAEKEAVHWDNLVTESTNIPPINNREISALLSNCEPKKLALMDLGYQDNLYVKISD